MPPPQDPHPIHAQLLGEVLIAWSKVTHQLEGLFIDLADLDNTYVVGVFVEKIRDGQLDDVVSALAGQLEVPSRDAIREWIKQVKAARTQRNEYLHGIYKPFVRHDGEEHLYLLGRRVLDRQHGTVEPNVTKLLSSSLNQFLGELAEIQRSYDRLQETHRPYPVRQHGATPADDNSPA